MNKTQTKMWVGVPFSDSDTSRQSPSPCFPHNVTSSSCCSPRWQLVLHLNKHHALLCILIPAVSALCLRHQIKLCLTENIECYLALICNFWIDLCRHSQIAVTSLCPFQTMQTFNIEQGLSKCEYSIHWMNTDIFPYYAPAPVLHLKVNLGRLSKMANSKTVFPKICRESLQLVSFYSHTASALSAICVRV